MRKPALIPAFWLLVILSSCNPPVTFDQPQPANTRSLTAFPTRLQGNYQSQKDFSLLNISNKAILRTYDYDLKSNINELDSNFRLKGDTVINLSDNARTAVKRTGDTIVFHIHYADTLFQLSEENVLKKFKGSYFMSSRYQKSGWEVEKLVVHSGRLMLCSIKGKEEIDRLMTITESKSDTISRQFQPTKKQFRKFVKAEGFSNQEEFMRLK